MNVVLFRCGGGAYQRAAGARHCVAGARADGAVEERRRAQAATLCAVHGDMAGFGPLSASPSPAPYDAVGEAAGEATVVIRNKLSMHPVNMQNNKHTAAAAASS